MLPVGSGDASALRTVDRARLAALPFSYDAVGTTARSATPNGYHGFRVRRSLGTGPACFAESTRRLMSWDMHRRAGVRVNVDGPVAPGRDAVLGLRIGRWWIAAPVRVVEVVDAAAVRGFSYGTLPGHPERGEERFIVSIDDDGVVSAEISAFSRPGRWFTRLAGPVGRHLQARTTERYLAALGP